MKSKKDILTAIIVTAFVILGCFDEKIPTEQQEPVEDLIRWKQEEMIEEVSVEPLEIGTVSQQVEEVTFYDVPLSKELQIHIFKECEKYNISPSVVIAVIEQESDYIIDAVGDNGKSFGLMQIQEHHHKDRMNRLGCTDLLDPFQNATVGINYLAELKNENSDLYWVLMAYNGGRAYSTSKLDSGDYSDYVIEVTERISELEGGVDYVMD